MFSWESFRMWNRYFTCIAVLGFLYPLGKIFQIWLIGPSWVRWYVADIGFISSVAVFFAIMRIPLFNHFGRSMAERMKYGMDFGAFMAIMVEFIQLAMKPYVTEHKGFMASGDWVDMGIFVVMYGVNRILYTKLNNSLQPAKPSSVRKRSRKPRPRKKMKI